MRSKAGAWVPCESGWGLVDARTGRGIDPPALISDERIEMTDWELQDFAVQIVRDQLEKSGRKLMSWQGSPGVDPSVFFVGDAGRQVWSRGRAPAADAGDRGKVVRCD